MVPSLELLVLRLYHLPHAATIERLTYLKWLDIAGLVKHTSAHIWVNRHIEVAHKYLASTGGRDWNSREFKIARTREADGTALQPNFTAQRLRHKHFLSARLVPA
jgi:hypothetical protein